MVMAALLLGLAVHLPAASNAPKEAPKKVPVSTRTVSVEFKAPDGGWVGEVEEVWRVNEELVLVVRAKRPPGVLAARMISTVTAEVTDKFPELPVRGLVLGRTWKLENDNPRVEFVDEESDAYKARRQGKRLWRRPPPPDDAPSSRPRD